MAKQPKLVEPNIPPLCFCGGLVGEYVVEPLSSPPKSSAKKTPPDGAPAHKSLPTGDDGLSTRGGPAASGDQS